jgi:hypothetical protein
MRTSALLFILLLLNGGCYFGDRIPEQRAVTLSLSAPQNQSAAGLSVDSTQTQEALKLIDTEMVAKGFVRVPKPEGASGQDLIASYAQYSSTGLRIVGGPGLYLKDERLRVVFSAGGNMGSRIDPKTQRIMESLRDVLSHHYGPDKVKIER